MIRTRSSRPEYLILHACRRLTRLRAAAPLLAVLGLWLAPLAASHAALPEQITFQGLLTEQDEPYSGTAQLGFALFAESAGGAALWTRSPEAISVTDGIYAVALGPFPGLDFDQPYWLEVTVDGSPLEPRYPLLSVPYALRALTVAAPPAGEIYDDRFVNTGEVDAITPEMIVTDVLSGLSGVTHDGGAIQLVAGENITIAADDEANTITISAPPAGGGGITEILAGSGLVATDPTGPQVGLAVGAGDGIAASADAISVVAADLAGDGLVGDAANNLEVATGPGLDVTSDAVHLESSFYTGSAYDARFVNSGDMAGGDLVGVYPDPRVTKIQGNWVSDAPPEPEDVFHWNGTTWMPSSDSVKLPFVGSSDSDQAPFTIHSTSPASFTGAIYGDQSVTDWYGTGVRGRGGLYGVLGEVYPTGSGNYAGIYGIAEGGIGKNSGVFGYAEGRGASECVGVNGFAYGGPDGTVDVYGLYGYAVGGTDGVSYGIYASANGGAARWAGYFGGDVHVNGTLTKAGGAFRIDHPLDPENRYLQHSFVESPDMLNVYAGNVVTDERGYATVTLPDWFEPLNRDFRYQLTVLDPSDGAEFVQAKIARKIEGNRFTLRTSAPRTEVSWQVVGTRQDAYANEHRVQVEVDKSPAERGKYEHPTLFGAPETSGIGYRTPASREHLRDTHR